MLKLWRWYQHCLAVHPVKTQVISSGILWGLGDVGAQAITHSTLKNQRRASHSQSVSQSQSQAHGDPVRNYWSFAFLPFSPFYCFSWWFDSLCRLDLLIVIKNNGFLTKQKHPLCWKINFPISRLGNHSLSVCIAIVLLLTQAAIAEKFLVDNVEIFEY